MVESVQLPLADRLERLIETNHPDEPRLFARALGLLADFRSNQFTLPFNSKSRSVEESRIPGVDNLHFLSIVNLDQWRNLGFQAWIIYTSFQ